MGPFRRFRALNPHGREVPGFGLIHTLLVVGVLGSAMTSRRGHRDDAQAVVDAVGEAVTDFLLGIRLGAAQRTAP